MKKSEIDGSWRAEGELDWRRMILISVGGSATRCGIAVGMRGGLGSCGRYCSCNREDLSFRWWNSGF